MMKSILLRWFFYLRRFIERLRVLHVYSFEHSSIREHSYFWKVLKTVATKFGRRQRRLQGTGQSKLKDDCYNTVRNGQGLTLSAA